MDLCMISNEQLICDHKNKNLQKRVSVTSQREALKFWISLKPKSGCSLLPTSNSNNIEAYKVKFSNQPVCLRSSFLEVSKYSQRVCVSLFLSLYI